LQAVGRRTPAGRGLLAEKNPRTWLELVARKLAAAQEVIAMAERSKHQQKIIKNYYDNREAISLQRLSELVTDLYLAEGKKRIKQWEYIVAALEKLKIPRTRIDHLLKQDNPALVAKLVEELLAKSG
jgi:hypothetical protein